MSLILHGNVSFQLLYTPKNTPINLVVLSAGNQPEL